MCIPASYVKKTKNNKQTKTTTPPPKKTQQQQPKNRNTKRRTRTWRQTNYETEQHSLRLRLLLYSEPVHGTDALTWFCVSSEGYSPCSRISNYLLHLRSHDRCLPTLLGDSLLFRMFYTHADTLITAGTATATTSTTTTHYVVSFVHEFLQCFN